MLNYLAKIVENKPKSFIYVLNFKDPITKTLIGWERFDSLKKAEKAFLRARERGLTVSLEIKQ